ncbi:MAG: type IIL restriction-modification enzyme MmeI [Methylotenera sp.]
MNSYSKQHMLCKPHRYCLAGHCFLVRLTKKKALKAPFFFTDLYDPLTMPANLLKAHQALDKAVDAAYGYKGASTDAARVAFLFELYQKVTSLLPVEKARKARKTK